MDIFGLIAIIGSISLDVILFAGAVGFIYRGVRGGDGPYVYYAATCCLALFFLATYQTSIMLEAGLTQYWEYRTALRYLFVISFIGYWRTIIGHRFILVKYNSETNRNI